MKIHAIQAGNFKLDGGAMFGVVPKSVWSKTNVPDENNMCSWSTRCMLIETGNRLILVDNGLGDKQDAKFFSYYYLHGDFSLEKSLNQAGFSSDDITDMFLTHLHFDHCGGSIKYADSGRTKLTTAFKNATYWSNKAHWEWAIHPNTREKASFLKENIMPIQESGQLKWIEKEGEFIPGIDVIFVYGHTEAMMLPVVSYKGTKLLYTADLIPSFGHIPIPYVMGYDMRPLETLKEKERILLKAQQENWKLFFEHDSQVECCSLKATEKGVRMDNSLFIKDL